MIISIFISLFFIINANANNFFGIPILGEPKDQLHAIIFHMQKEDYFKANAYLEQFKKSTPKISKNLSLKNLTIPCVDCHIEVDPACKAYDEDELTKVDYAALNYLQYKLDLNLEDELDLKNAWESAYNSFSEKVDQVLLREVLQGQVVSAKNNIFVIKNIDGQLLYILGGITEGYKTGDTLACYGWPMKTKNKSYQNTAGEVLLLPVYTMNLWWDY